MIEGIERMADDIRTLKLLARLRQYARAIQSYVAVADNGGIIALEKWV